MREKLYAVLTGDIAKSSRFTGNDRKILLDNMKMAFRKTGQILGTDAMAFPFDIFRGDSYQGVLQQAGKALTAAVLIRASIRSAYNTTLKNAVDTRIAVGIGTISHLPDTSSGEGDGEAYRNSGPFLDKMTKHARMTSIVTPWPEINAELNVECAMLDAIIARWTAVQADVAIEYIIGKTQEEMAEKFKISQPAVKKRIASANIYQLELLLERFDYFFKSDNYKPVRL